MHNYFNNKEWSLLQFFSYFCPILEKSMEKISRNIDSSTNQYFVFASKQVIASNFRNSFSFCLICTTLDSIIDWLETFPQWMEPFDALNAMNGFVSTFHTRRPSVMSFEQKSLRQYLRTTSLHSGYFL